MLTLKRRVGHSLGSVPCHFCFSRLRLHPWNLFYRYWIPLSHAIVPEVFHSWRSDVCMDAAYWVICLSIVGVSIELILLQMVSSFRSAVGVLRGACMGVTDRNMRTQAPPHGTWSRRRATSLGSPSRCAGGLD